MSVATTKLYFRNPDTGDVTDHDLFHVDAHHALRFPHQWATTPDGHSPPPEAEGEKKKKPPAEKPAEA